MEEIVDQQAYPAQPEFLQSWEYGDFLIANNRKVKRIHIGESYVQYVVNPLPLGQSFVYLPRAIVQSEDTTALLAYFSSEGHTFVRAETRDECTWNTKTIQTKNRQPKHTWLLDVTSDEESLMAQMHSKTRYNIRLADRKGVVIDQKKDLELFWELNTVTTERNNYTSHSRSYIEKLLAQGNTYQVNAYVENTPVASAVLLKHEGVLIYFFGASSNEHRNVMAPYLLHFDIIKLAKELGCTQYDFWGIAPPAEKGSGQESCYHKYCWQADHPLAGVSRFKAGFGGELRSYPTAVEIPLKKLYDSFFRLVKKIKGSGHIVGHPR